MIPSIVLSKIIRESIDSITGINGLSIDAKQLDAPRPTGNYATVDVSDDRANGWEEVELLDNNLDPDIAGIYSGYREITFSINFFRSGAVDLARASRTGFVRESISEAFKAGKIGLLSRSEVREISLALENGYEERAQFDLTISAVGTDTEILRSVEVVSIELRSQYRNVEHIAQIEVNKP